MSNSARFTELQERLELENAVKPFFFSNEALRDNQQRVEKIAMKCGLTAVRYRGFIEFAGTSGDHLWIDIEGKPIDVTLPVQNNEFKEVFRAFVASDAEIVDVNQAIKQTDFSERLLPLSPVPVGVRYVGQPLFLHR